MNFSASKRNHLMSTPSDHLERNLAQQWWQMLLVERIGLPELGSLDAVAFPWCKRHTLHYVSSLNLELQSSPVLERANTECLVHLLHFKYIQEMAGELKSSILLGLLVLSVGAPADCAKLPSVSCTAHDNSAGHCTLLIHCTKFFADLAKLSRTPCTISPQQQGICCPNSKTQPKDPNTLIKPQRPAPVSGPRISTDDLNRNCQKSIQKQNERENFEKVLVANNIVATKGSPVYLHARLFETTNSVVNKGKGGSLVLDAGSAVAQDLQLPVAEASQTLSSYSVDGTIISGVCPIPPTCGEPSRYRSIDGSCNNVNHPDWGQAATPFFRLLPPVYSDGFSSFRTAKDGVPLPSPRNLSVATIVHRDDVYEDYTLYIMQWGQFLDHDLTHTPITKGADKSDITCCVAGSIRPPHQLHPECQPIVIPAEDPFYGPFGQRCMEFVRSMPAIRKECKFGPREQMNQITSYLDASNVYGSSAEEMQELREFKGGRMKATVRGNRHLLPPNVHDAECDSPMPDRPCFGAGDTRVNEQPNLAAMHTVWMRQHNLVAQTLALLNPSWSDEIVFQEARRIIGAQMQHITYNEYLPIVLGRHFVETFGLIPEKEGYSNSYDPNEEATVSNAFATAAFRYGHTLIDSKVQGYSRFGTKELGMKLSSVQFSPFFLYDAGAHDALIRGLAIQPSQKFDNFFSEELTNHLFARNNSFGMDLVALNLQRGRDHGLPPYIEWRKICRMPPVSSFEELNDVMHPEASTYLSLLYKNVEDIDLFLGGILEFPVANALVGHTFLCILGDQFYRLKAADRFYYENGGFPSSFTPEQLQELKKTSLARVLCDTSDEMSVMQPLVFLHANFTNKRASCRHDKLIPKLDYSPWKSLSA
ncbi:hypothetical protein FHG87_001410 [Trinorchestia longiramus]|nr:hypothetical protein FHG87_001410 [Trinorchestia longiramus]